MIEDEVTYDDICKSREIGQVIFPGYRNYTTALALCQNVGGTLLQIETEAQQNSAVELIKTSSICSDNSVYGTEGTWIAWWDQNQEGEWISSIDSSKILETNDFQSWEPGEPNGLTIENCAALKRTGTLSNNLVKSIQFEIANLLQDIGMTNLVVLKCVQYVT